MCSTQLGGLIMFEYMTAQETAECGMYRYCECNGFARKIVLKVS